MTCIAICGDSASGKSVFAERLATRLGDCVILETDRYHKFERHNPVWNEYTQLNPQMNDLELLNQDVQALKDGKTIWRRNYDHTTGKFTEEHEIKPAKNIIVCGLHVLMCPEDLYDLKIYLDTDEELKREWKIERDVNKRGYTLEQVEKQIERRKDDYMSYVAPLIFKANFVIHYHGRLIMSTLLAAHVAIHEANKPGFYNIYKNVLEII